jgi:hypothetical protein
MLSVDLIFVFVGLSWTLYDCRSHFYNVIIVNYCTNRTRALGTTSRICLFCFIRMCVHCNDIMICSDKDHVIKIN